MFDWLHWFTELENSKTVAVVLFFGLFCVILLYVYTGKSRTNRLESYKYIPLDDDDGPTNFQESSDRKVKKDGRGENE